MKVISIGNHCIGLADPGLLLRWKPWNRRLVPSPLATHTRLKIATRPDEGESATLVRGLKAVQFDALHTEDHLRRSLLLNGMTLAGAAAIPAAA
jgi:hypothetical protein